MLTAPVLYRCLTGAAVDQQRRPDVAVKPHAAALPEQMGAEAAASSPADHGVLDPAASEELKPRELLYWTSPAEEEDPVRETTCHGMYLLTLPTTYPAPAALETSN